MRKLDFISKSPNFYIFNEGANKTNLGGFLFMVYLLIIVLLAAVYFYDYFSNDKYSFTYSLVQKNINDPENDKNEQMKSMLNKELNFRVYLGKDINKRYYNFSNNDFIILDIGKLSKRLIGNDIILNSTEDSNDDECIIKQGTILNTV